MPGQRPKHGLIVCNSFNTLSMFLHIKARWENAVQRLIITCRNQIEWQLIYHVCVASYMGLLLVAVPFSFVHALSQSVQQRPPSLGTHLHASRASRPPS